MPLEEDLNGPQSAEPLRFANWWWFAGVFTIFGCALLVIAALRLVPDQFPVLATGSYIGSIEGIFGSSAKVPIVIEKDGNSELLVAIFYPGFEPQKIIPASDNNESFSLPLIVSNRDRSLQLSGRKDGAVVYGDVKDLVSKEKGTFRLLPISIGENALPKPEIEQVLLLRAELMRVESRIAEAERVVPQQRLEIEKLQKYVTEGDTLKSRANEKYRALFEKVAAAKAELAAAEDEAKQVARNFDISQKVSGMGRLVALSRESLDREQRWVLSMLGSGISRLPEGFDGELERALRVSAIKKNLKSELDQIDHLLGRDREGDPDSENGSVDQGQNLDDREQNSDSADHEPAEEE